MTPKSKFKPGEIVYYKYPSRYSRTKDPKTIEVIVRIEQIVSDHGYSNIDYFYQIHLIKVVKAQKNHWSSYNPSQHIGYVFGVDSVDLETYSRRLTPTEMILYG